MTDTTPATEVLAGLVERVTFHNPENGFCVLRVKARGHRDLVTTVGHAAMISAGEGSKAYLGEATGKGLGIKSKLCQPVWTPFRRNGERKREIVLLH